MYSDNGDRIIHPFTYASLKLDEMKVYVPEFREVFQNPNIRNIAISGSYGAGKSSVIRSWEKWHGLLLDKDSTEHRYLYLSLANFKDGSRPTTDTHQREKDRIKEANSVEKSHAHDREGIEAPPTSSDDSASAVSDGSVNSISSNAIEAMLINQLVHKVPASKSPRCKFKRTAAGKEASISSAKTAVIATLLLALLFITYCGISHFGSVDGMHTAFPFLSIALLIAYLILFGLGAYQIASRQSLQGLIRRIKIQGNEIELNSSDDFRAFDRHLDDILYLFKSSGCDVVVFEDLDRFGKLPVFEDLREVNDLLNYGREDSDPIRFFYLVKDDMFESRDRAKFFDLIIPVIPFVDPSNADSHLLRELGEVGLTVDPGFAYELSLYIDDPRVIHDIANTAGHIKAAVFDAVGADVQTGEAERIVAVAALKALYPHDYAELQVGRGVAKNAIKEFTEEQASDDMHCDNDFIKHLVVNGFLDETYERYISNCYENGSSSDRQVLAQIARKAEVDPCYTFTYPDKAVAKLTASRFSQRNARNYSLTREVLRGTFPDKEACLLDGIEKDHDLGFILGFVNSKFSDSSSIKVLWEQFARDLAEIPSAPPENSSDSEIRKYCQVMITKGVNCLDTDVALSSAVAQRASDDPDFLHEEIPLDTSLIAVLDRIGYSAKDINVEAANPELLAAMYKQRLFEPNVALLEKLCISQHSLSSMSLDNGKIVDRLRKEKEWGAHAAVLADPRTFLSSLIERYKTYHETEDSIAWITGFSEVSNDLELLDRYADCLEGSPVTKIQVLPNKEAMELFAAKGKVEPSFANALHLYQQYETESGCSNEVVFLLNERMKKKTPLEKTASKLEHAESLLLDLAALDGISTELLSWVAKGFDEDGVAINEASLQEDRVRILVKAHAVAMTVDNLKYMRANHADLVLDFALSRIESYIKLINSDSTIVSEQEIKTLVTGGEITTPANLNEILYPLPIGSTIRLDECPETLYEDVIRYHLDSDDLAQLNDLYLDPKHASLENVIIERCVDDVDKIIEGGIFLGENLLNHVLASPNLSSKQREELIAIECHKRRYAEYCLLFKTAGLGEYYLALTKAGRRQVPVSTASSTLLKDMKERGFISSYTDAGNGQYWTNGKKTHPELPVRQV